ILYLDPWAVAEALGQGALPFVADAVACHPALQAAVAVAFEDPDLPLEPLARDRVVLAVADGLAAAASIRAPLPRVPDRPAVQRARDCLDANLAAGIDSRTLERASGLSRFALARHFRACLGTSPHRYLVQRRLELVRRLAAEGMGLAAAAVEAGFADQSHMTRHFRRSYGIAPGRWLALARASAASGTVRI
ncbi:helix-turn-helix domain-containing protein, partial [Marinibaculum pumilum]